MIILIILSDSWCWLNLLWWHQDSVPLPRSKSLSPAWDGASPHHELSQTWAMRHDKHIQKPSKTKHLHQSNKREMINVFRPHFSQIICIINVHHITCIQAASKAKQRPCKLSSKGQSHCSGQPFVQPAPNCLLTKLYKIYINLQAPKVTNLVASHGLLTAICRVCFVLCSCDSSS